MLSSQAQKAGLGSGYAAPSAKEGMSVVADHLSRPASRIGMCPSPEQNVAIGGVVVGIHRGHAGPVHWARVYVMVELETI